MLKPFQGNEVVCGCVCVCDPHAFLLCATDIFMMLQRCVFGRSSFCVCIQRLSETERSMRSILDSATIFMI